MDDALLVRCRETTANLDRIVEDLLERQRAVSENLAQRPAFEPFRNDEWRSLMGADFMNREDIGMIQRGCSAGFLIEPPEPIGVVREDGGQNFDGDMAPEARIMGTKDNG
jgi:hypothetical protein